MNEEHFNKLYELIKDNNKGIKELKIGIDKLEQRIDKLEQRIDKLEQRIDGLEQRIDKFEEEVNARFTVLEIVIRDLVSRVEKLEKEVRGIIDEYKYQSTFIAQLFNRVKKLDGISLNEEQVEYFARNNIIEE